MGVISILLGILSFLCVSASGVMLANALVEAKDVFAQNFTQLANISNANLIIAIVIVFAALGLFIGFNLIMYGLSYRKLCKLEKHRRRH